jgi:hypothetical protein
MAQSHGQEAIAPSEDVGGKAQLVKNFAKIQLTVALVLLHVLEICSVIGKGRAITVCGRSWEIPTQSRAERHGTLQV